MIYDATFSNYWEIEKLTRGSLLSMGKECKLKLPDYFVNDDFILTFTQLLSYMGWIGIPWQLTKRQLIWSNTVLLTLTVCIIFASKRMLMDYLFDQVFMQFIGVMKFVHGFLTIVIIRRLRIKWPLITKAWTTGNLALPEMAAGYTTLRKNMLKIFVLFAFLYTFDRLFAIVTVKLNNSSSYQRSLLDRFNAWSHSVTASSSWYAPYVAVLMGVLVPLSLAVTNIEDFIVVAFGMGLADRQKKLNKVLKGACERDSVYRKNVNNGTSEWMKVIFHACKAAGTVNVGSSHGPSTVSNDAGLWRRLREAFVRHSRLVTIVNEAIGPLIFLSVFRNLSFILIILAFRFKTVETGDLLSLSYYVYAFISLLLRSFIMLVKTSEVHDLSTFGGEYLKMCSIKSYNVEMRRFYFQLSKNDVALSGMGFFRLRRVFMLNALSVIVTYHLMLLQYNDRLS